MGISNYIFDEHTFVRNRGSKNEQKVLECKLQVESPISLYKIKSAQTVMDLLKKHAIYITAKSYSPAVSTKAIGILMNLDAKRSAKNIIIDTFKDEVDSVADRNVFIDLVPHRGLVRINKKVIYGHFLKVMVDVEYATTAAKTIQDGLKNEVFGIGLKHVRLMPVYPIPNLMPVETFGKMILAHNDSMYNIAEIQVDNVWDIDTEARLPDAIKKRFNLPFGEEHADDLYTLRDTIMPIFWGHYKNEPIVRDVYIMRGRLMIVCEKKKVAETTKLVDMLFDFMKQEYDVDSTLVKNADKFAEWVGCSTPKNSNRHPARSGTLVFGEADVLKATVNSFLDHNLEALPSGLVPKAGKAAKAPDLTRPPPPSLMPRGRARQLVDPKEFSATAINAWAAAKTWAGVATVSVDGGSKQPKRNTHPPIPAKAVIDLDNTTGSTVSMNSGTQAAIDALKTTMKQLDLDKKTNEEKITKLDAAIEHIAKEVTVLAEAHRKSSAEYVHIKEQIASIAKENGQARYEMMEMKSLIMSIATHLNGGETPTINPLDPSLTPPSQLQTQLSSPLSFGFTHPHLDDHHAHDNDASMPHDETMTDSSQSDDANTDDARKKLKPTHVPIFDIQEGIGQTTLKANHLNLPPSAVDLLNGSNGNHQQEVDLASMQD